MLGDTLLDADALRDAVAVGVGVGLQGSQQAPGLVALPAHSQLAGGQAS